MGNGKEKEKENLDTAKQIIAASSDDGSSDKLENETARVTDDGRIDVYLDSRLSRALSKLVPNSLPAYSEPSQPLIPPPEYTERISNSVKLNIVIQVVGSRGDVQPFIALGNEMQKYGHRVRLATHDTFENFVREHGLEFYPIGGDPAELMSFMVKNPGLIPRMSSIAGGEIQAKRKMIATMLKGCWDSCIEKDLRTGAPFTADAIIANPPSFAHVHCAQALGCPVHVMFTMPWSCTNAFSHPLANLKFSKKDGDLPVRNANYLSYIIVEWMTWQGLGDIINKFRKSIDLEPVPETEAPFLLETLKVPFTYCWSPALVPKPLDWPSHIDVCGFFFREPPKYTPPDDLRAFLDYGSMPIYIGFGSIVIDDPDKVTAILLEAVEATGVRAIISRGWSKLGGGFGNSDKVFYLDDCPHEWLFQNVAAVMHHGGAGTTACGLLNGRPTTIVPFFGDQPFWGDMVAVAGAGPEPIPYKQLTTENIAAAIALCLRPETLTAAQAIALRMKNESGVRTAVDSFHRALPQDKLRCDILPDQPAVWLYKKNGRRLRLSKLAAQTASGQNILDIKDLQYHEASPIVIETRRWDPATGVTSAGLGMLQNAVVDLTGIVTKPIETYRDGREQKKDRLRTASLPSSSRSSSQQRHIHQGSQAELQQQFESQLQAPAQDAQPQQSTASAMAKASAKSLGHLFGRPTKSIYVDMPLALADGLAAVPKLYGGEALARDNITDVKSGVAAAGKNFAFGLASGLSGLVLEPIQGGKKEGALGVLKGLGKGTAGFLVKTGSAGVGLVAYPGQGISRSIHTAFHAKTRALVIERKKEEGNYLARNLPGGINQEKEIARKLGEYMLDGL